MVSSNIAAVEAYINSLKAKDLSLAPFAEDILSIDPIIGELRGAQGFRGHLANFLPIINDVKIIRHLTDGDSVATQWEVHTAMGVIPIFELFKVENGLITEAVGYFDPRPLLNG